MGSNATENQDEDFELEVKQFFERIHDVETFIRQTSEVVDSYQIFANTNRGKTVIYFYFMIEYDFEKYDFIYYVRDSTYLRSYKENINYIYKNC